MICWGGISGGAIYSRAQAECFFTQEAESAQRRHKTQLQKHTLLFPLTGRFIFLFHVFSLLRQRQQLPSFWNYRYLFIWLFSTNLSVTADIPGRDEKTPLFVCAWTSAAAAGEELKLVTSSEVRGRRHYDPDVTWTHLCKKRPPRNPGAGAVSQASEGSIWRKGGGGRRVCVSGGGAPPRLSFLNTTVQKQSSQRCCLTYFLPCNISLKQRREMA